jgi:outer membrane protein OmpA-like peptidoglycan-associated protein
VTAEGRPRNLGEIVVAKGKGSIETTEQASAFGLLVTAEPYFAVGTPSEVVVLRNAFVQGDETKASPREVTFEAFARETYAATAAPAPGGADRPPFDLFQARNAVRIAHAFGAEEFAAEPFGRAEQALKQAESFAKDKKQRKQAPLKAREAVQSAESARVLAVRMIDEARVAAEKAEAAARAAAAQAESARAQADAARARAERERAETESLRAQAESARAQAEAAVAQSQTERAQAAAAEESRRRASAEVAAAAAEQARQQAEAEKHALRARLLDQLNHILETRDSARGLIVNLGDVLFDLNKFTLRPEAREKLAKLSGLVLGNQGLKLAVEGHTDATGSDAYNQKLSEDRAGAVRDYLVQQQIPADSVSAAGFGKTRPVAPNDTPAGRQKNRRVEIVVSGDIIGTAVEQEKAATPGAPAPR